MREIKFRAWSKKHNKYLKITGIQYDGDKIAGVFVVYGTIAGIPNIIFLEPEDVVLEQYTGLNDKNGKEIYEGDIVRVGGKWRFAVAYTRAFCAFELQNLDREECMDLRHEHMKRYEVIGNIYENPELCGEEEE